MSVENIKRFQKELQKNDELKEKLKGLKLSYENLEELISFAKEAGFDFTVEELKAVNSGAVGEELSLDELDKVVGGLRNDDGYLLTTVAYSCGNWSASGAVWAAVKGQCGSCGYWGAHWACYWGVPGTCYNEDNKIG